MSEEAIGFHRLGASRTPALDEQVDVGYSLLRLALACPAGPAWLLAGLHPAGNSWKLLGQPGCFLSTRLPHHSSVFFYTNDFIYLLKILFFFHP
jgi:hypothetical protein